MKVNTVVSQLKQGVATPCYQTVVGKRNDIVCILLLNQSET